MTNFKTLFDKYLFNLMGKFGFDPEKFIHTLNKIRYPSMDPKTSKNKDIINAFAKLFYDQGKRGGTWNNTYFLGVRVMKSPLDLWVYQEIIYKIRPNLIIETGTAFGGSALYFASILDLIGKGKVISVDIFKMNRPFHKRIKYLKGSSIHDFIVDEIKKEAKRAKKIIVILDSDHKKRHVYKELLIYSKLVSVGSYLIVEDTNVNGRPVLANYGPGPHEAVSEFLKHYKNYERDKSWEKYLLTNNPGGYLHRTE